MTVQILEVLLLCYFFRLVLEAIWNGRHQGHRSFLTFIPRRGKFMLFSISMLFADARQGILAQQILKNI